MKDLIVITAASSVQGTMPLYLRQLMDAGIDVHVEDTSKLNLTGAGGDLGFKIHWLREFSQRFAEYEAFVLTDAFDVTFYGTREQVIKKIPRKGVLWGAEKNCYPDPHIASRITGSTPWHLANGGLLCGTPGVLLDWCEAAERHPLYDTHLLDQEFLNMLLAEKDPLAQIDSCTAVFFCLYGGYDELEFTKGIPLNTTCCTFPNFVHANGKWDAGEMFARCQRSLV